MNMRYFTMYEHIHGTPEQIILTYKIMDFKTKKKVKPSFLKQKQYILIFTV